MATNPVFAEIESFGIDYELFREEFSKKLWRLDELIFVAVLGAVESAWAEDQAATIRPNPERTHHEP